MKRKHHLNDEPFTPPENRTSAMAAIQRPAADRLAALNKFVEPRDFGSCSELAARNCDRWEADRFPGAQSFPPRTTP